MLQKSPNPMVRLLRWGCFAIFFAVFSIRVAGDELHLDNGMVIQGTVVRVPGLDMQTAERNNVSEIRNLPFYMVDDGVRQYFVSTRHAQVVDYDPLNPYVTFELFQQKAGRSIGPSVIGGVQLEPFDQFGRRTVTLSTNKEPVRIVQGITELRPDWAKIEGLTHVWEYRIDTRTIPDDVLQAMVERQTDQANSEARKLAVQFFLQADKAKLAQAELDRIAADFPELAEWCRGYQQQIRELTARIGMNELKLRRGSGQHQLAYYIVKQVPPDDVSADVLLEAREVTKDYESALEKRDHVLMLLDQFHAALPMETARELMGMRGQMQDELHYETIGRLDPFLRVQGDVALTAEQKLALAYSGWILGTADATEELEIAQNLWSARFLVLEYLRSEDSLRRDEILGELAQLEGVSVARVAKLIKLLPMPFEPPTQEAATVTEVEFKSDPSKPARRYTLVLPPEYSPYHRYPLLISLRSEGRTYTDAAQWWSGDAQHQGWAQRRGYVVIAPHYLTDESEGYAYSAESHAIVRECLEHVRKRYRINSDRVFLAGHAMGANATFDIALSSPDLFAGAVSIAGMVERHSVYLWENGSGLAWYVVGGERDRQTLEVNVPKLNRMLVKHQDMIYCSYKARGYESYSEEQERIFEWMQTKSRLLLGETVDFEIGSVRMTDNHFHWLAGYSLPDKLFPPVPATTPAAGVVARTFKAHIAPGGPVYVQHPGRETTLWFSPDLIDFDVRHRISINGKVVSNGFIEPSMSVLLETLRMTGDRERLFWARQSY